MNGIIILEILVEKLFLYVGTALKINRLYDVAKMLRTLENYIACSDNSKKNRDFVSLQSVIF